MSSIFSKIINGDIPCHKIAENDSFFAFLDINPVAKGHILVVPKIETDYIFDLEDDILSGYLPFCKKISVALKAVVPCERIGITVIGLEVPHAHIHLIPINSLHDMNFAKPKLELSQDELAELALSVAALIT